jgi:hypothetical protein
MSGLRHSSGVPRPWLIDAWLSMIVTGHSELTAAFG